MPPAAAAEISPPSPASDGQTTTDTAEAGVTAGEEMEMEDREEVASEEDPEEVPEAGPGDGAVAAAESGVVTKEAGGDGETAVEVSIKDGGDQETRDEPVEVEPKEEVAVPVAISDGGDLERGVEPVGEPKDVMEADEEPIEPEDEDPEEPEEAEDGDEPEEAEEEDPEELAGEEPAELELEEEEPDHADAEEAAEEDDEGGDMNEIVDKDSEEAQDNDKHGDNDKDQAADRLSNDEDAGARENDDPPNDELDKSLSVLDSVSDGNDEIIELFVGGLPKDCVQEDIRVVFSQCGEIESITAKKKKGIAFVRYADTNAAKKALSEFKDGIEVKGKNVRVSIAEPHRKSSEKALVKVKTVYLEHFPSSWDEKNIEEFCKAYGSIQKVNILRSKKKVFSFVEFSSRKSALACVEGINNADICDEEVKLAASLARPQSKVRLANESTKHGLKVQTDATSKSPDKSKMIKDQRDEVLLKKSQRKLLKGNESKLPFQDDVEVPEISTRSKGKAKVGKRQNTSVVERPSKKARKSGDESKLPSQDEGKVGKSKNTSSSERPLKKASKYRDDGKLASQGGLEEAKPQTSNRSKHKRKVRMNKNTTVNERPAEKAWKNRNMKRPAGSRYANNNQAYPSAGATSRSKLHAHDLEPHAGFIAPSNRVQRTTHDHRRTAPYIIHQNSNFPYARERAAPQPAYSVHTSNAAGYEAGYAYTYLPPPPPPPSLSYHPPPPPSVSYHPGSGTYITRRYY
ncbi:nucleolin-like isoform X2 [Oryza brachyantha]|uniref:nucleolin-like isoform X2 n=1 Tax=Oryza brachyantha TaxID=4533 RepID=UPI000776457E|nr:nucleolin-like isoform X2 [Oryza brachyantha]